MHFETQTIYHLYNQGNKGQEIFFSRSNYLFFLRKARTYLLPHCDILCYCLLPNHFHFLIYVNEVERLVKNKKSGLLKPRTINDSISIMLRSYTRAVNESRGESGSLFRQETKAKNGDKEHFITLLGSEELFFGGGDYGVICFDYIHENPPKAGLVSQSVEWEFSSAQDYAGLRNGTLCNQQLAKELGLF
ncbi:MAG: transposase [Bacteroidota bacterium]